jgi:hypothetical protein
VSARRLEPQHGGENLLQRAQIVDQRSEGQSPETAHFVAASMAPAKSTAESRQVGNFAAAARVVDAIL